MKDRPLQTKEKMQQIRGCASRTLRFAARILILGDNRVE
jgi:hypothetical protein